MVLDPDLKVKPFGVLLSNDIVVSIKSLLTETKMLIDNKMPNDLSEDITAKNIFDDSY